MKRVLLLINTGTPDRADRQAVGRYLREFLNDKKGHPDASFVAADAGEPDPSSLSG